MEEKKIYTVYVHTNLINGMQYVGITRKKPHERWHKGGSGYCYNKPFYDDILRYGWDEGFSHDIIATGLTCYEAAKMERELIQKYDTFKNGYNRTLGGEGGDGFVVGSPIRERMSPEVYAEWSAKNAERMKRLGIERTRKVISLTENIIYESAVEASEKTGVPVTRVRDMCRRNKRTHFCDANGYYYRFCWYGEDLDITQDEFTIAYYKRPIICLETEQIFASAKEAEHVMGISDNLINQVCAGVWISAHGYKFIYYSDYVNGKRDTRPSKNIEKNKHEVICVETDKVYYNCVEASKDIGCKPNMVNRATHNFNFTCKGFHFADYKDYVSSPEKYVLPEVVDQRVMQFDKFGNFIAEYSSYKEASQILEVDKNNIHAACSTGTYQRFICAESVWMLRRDYTPETLYQKINAYWAQNKVKSIGQYDLSGKLICIYDSATSAAKAVGCTPTPISASCRGKKGIIKGYNWEYVSPMYYLDNNINRAAV